LLLSVLLLRICKLGSQHNLKAEQTTIRPRNSLCPGAAPKENLDTHCIAKPSVFCDRLAIYVVYVEAPHGCVAVASLGFHSMRFVESIRNAEVTRVHEFTPTIPE
ncbi:hypothetical protein KCV07_g508, partial [Aureobasidium melanogenum]